MPDSWKLVEWAKRRLDKWGLAELYKWGLAEWFFYIVIPLTVLLFGYFFDDFVEYFFG